ncbi:MAG: hypothetical protein NT150_02500 [Bacteroidetes bacterium]|nr:hypothetical protein [Bacteroidota bacterium]
MAVKKYILFIVFGLTLSPVFTFAKGGQDSLNLGKAFLFNDFSLTNFQGLSKTKAIFTAPTSIAGKSSKITWFKSMRYSGYARFYPYYRNMKSYYNVASNNINGLTLPITLNADDGYQQPLMLFRLEGNPTAKTSFQTELQFSNLMKRTTTLTDSTGKLANLYVIFKLEGAVDTKLGHIRMIAGGGANWYRLSPSTLWGYQYRDDLFERYAWDPEGHDFSNRYNSAYSVGDIPRDQRFGMQAVQGFILEGTKLPAGFDAAILYGKNSTSGGFTSFISGTPMNMLAGRIGNEIKSQKLGFSYFNQYGYTSNKVDYKKIAQGVDTFYVEDNYVSQVVSTVDGRFDFKNFALYTEIGAGSYLSNTYNLGLAKGAKTGVQNVSHYNRKWDETMFFEITTKKRFTRIPIKLNAYRIGANVVNNTSSVSNTSIEQAKPSTDTPDEYYTNYYDGMVTDVGQLANNRQGVNLFVNKSFKKLMTKLEIGSSQEITNLVGDTRNGARSRFIAGNAHDSLSMIPFTNSITFEHRLNGLTRSRFIPYQRFGGPYSRLQSVYRRTFENISITDTIVNYKKSFSSMNLELKYKFKLVGKELILINYNNYSSVQDHYSPIPVFTDKAFLRIFYSELMAFYAIHSKVTIVSFVATERVLGNQRTELADASGNLITNAKGKPVSSATGKAVDQTGYGIGIGVDYNFHSRASLHWRNRWFSHSDKNFTHDNFKGYESTVEFKVFF